ncbi:mechanosensitive ion channel family protein [Halocola ammonii]
MENILVRLKTTIADYWEAFIQLLPDIIVGVLVVCFFALVAVGLSRFFTRRLERKKRENRIAIRFTIRLIRLIVILIGIVLAFQLMGFKNLAGGLLAGAGVGAVIIGFAFKEIGENFLSGIILVFDRPFSIGDTVTIGDKMGVVQELNFRNTHLKSFDGKDIFVPNASIVKNDLSNHTRDGLVRMSFVVGIDYKHSVKATRELILSELSKIKGILKDNPPLVVVETLAPNTVDLKVLFWVNTFDYKNSTLILKSEVMEMVKDLLIENKIGMPANIQELKMYSSDDFIPVKVLDQPEAKS